MPTYEYECSKCHKTLELVQSMKDKALTICPKDLCRQKTKWGKGPVKRKLGAGAGFIFKGSGFYITDYRSDAYKSKARSDTAAGTASTTKSEPSKSETAKPAAKPAAKSDS
jgi:putative FmdB family regulatory protein